MTDSRRNLSHQLITGSAKALVVIFVFAGYFAALADIVVA